ncbi:MAG: response regulator [Bacteroidales bacterium]|nr:response regulator [Bacteroidales bacterium]
MEKSEISVLFVDDEKILRTVYGKLIGDIVENVFLAENGQQGLEIYQKYIPDLVITDIKMPLMNGLDMTVMIKKLNPQARVILLSAYSESHYFIRAIDIGVKVFLLKPVENHKLFRIIDEQVHEIQLEKKMFLEEQRRIKAEHSLFRNEQILQAVSEVGERLIQSGYNKKSINYALSRLGQGAQVSRVYIFEVFKKDHEQYIKQTYEWIAEGIKSEMENLILQELPVKDPSFLRWAEIFSEKKTVYGLVKDFPKAERELIESQDIVSIIAVPIFVENEWFGFIGFDDCLYERIWTISEANTLMTAANIIGAAIYRSSIEEKLKKLNAELELRVRQRTRKLENEISERKLAEELLKQSEEKYRLVFENANDGIFLSINSKIQFINPRFYELTGYYPYQLTGKSFLDIIHPEFKEIVAQNYNKRLTGEDAMISYDIKIIDANDNEKWVEIKSSLIKWENDNAVLTFLTDVDARKRFEHELLHLNLNLEERVKKELKNREKQQQLFLQKSKLESLGELSAGIAHEINQPLGGISMSIENILDELNTNNISEDYLRNKISLMFSDIERIREIINHVRLFSREQDYNNHFPINLVEVVNNTLLLVNRLLIDNYIDLKIIVKEPSVMVLGNPLQLEQVLLNILSNAKHAVEKKSKNLGTDYSKKISMSILTKESFAGIEVEDNGVGIPNHLLNNIFDPFFTTKKADEGTGLGLSISYGIIRDMHGHIEVKSKEGEFTKISIFLPIYID